MGNFVSIKIPCIDRMSTDIHRLPCAVVKRLGLKASLVLFEVGSNFINLCQLLVEMTRVKAYTAPVYSRIEN